MHVRTKWFSPRALRLHLTLVLVAGGCVALGWWQLSRALSGNGLSWVYTVEWPFFAVYASYLWWKYLNEDDDVAVLETSSAHSADQTAHRSTDDSQATPGAPVVPGPAVTASAGGDRSPRRHRRPVSPPASGPTQLNGFDPYDDDTDPELAAYNRYLAGLHESDQARRSRR